MSNRVTITLTIDLPDGVVPDVDYGPEPADLRQIADQVFAQEIKAPAPKLETEARVGPYPPAAPVEFWPAGKCPIHQLAWKSNARGAYCSGRGGPGPLNDKGYCDLKPGMLWQDKKAA